MTNSIYVNWGGHNIKLTWYPTTQLPPVEKVTSVHGYCFQNNKVLLVHIKGRGFNIPGGHIENNETPEVALHREVYEEGYVRGTAKYIGMIEVSHEENPHFDPSGKYPLIGYQLFYRIDITTCDPFKREHEAISRIWVEPEELPFIIDDHEITTLILKEAIQ